jgi:hypothetical protein
VAVVLLDVGPHVACSHVVRIHISVVGLAIRQNQFTGLHNFAVNCFVAKGFSDKAIESGNGLETSVGTHVGLGERVSNFSEPGFTALNFGNDHVVGDDVHVAPEAVEKLVVPLVVHPHVNDVEDG